MQVLYILNFVFLACSKECSHDSHCCYGTGAIHKVHTREENEVTFFLYKLNHDLLGQRNIMEFIYLEEKTFLDAVCECRCLNMDISGCRVGR